MKTTLRIFFGTTIFAFVSNICFSQADCPAGTATDFSGSFIQTAGSMNGVYDVGDVFRFDDVLTSPFSIYAEVTIEAIQSAEIVNLDANNENPERLQPLISPIVPRDPGNYNGYVQFAVSFKRSSNDAIVFANSFHYRQYDLDGKAFDDHAWLREFGWITGQTSFELNNPTLITDDGTVTDGGYLWQKLLGPSVNSGGISNDPEIYFTANYDASPIIHFRLGFNIVKENRANNVNGQSRDYSIALSCFDIPAEIPLPVKLVGFNASYRNNLTRINWETQNEVNFEKFEIQRSIDGHTFQSIGQVLPATAINSRSKYQFTDNVSAISANTLYYRLEMIDKDGSFTYSAVVVLRKNDRLVKGLLITPNPAAYIAFVKFASIVNGQAELRVMDVSGKILLRQQNNLSIGNNNILINNISKIKAGNYIVQVQIGEEIASAQLSLIR